MVGAVSVNGGRVLSDRLLNVRGQCSPQHVRTRLARLRRKEGEGVQPEGDVHGGGWHQAPHAQETLAHVPSQQV